MNWTEVFSAGLVGSLLTLIITKGFELLGTRQDNAFQLRRIYFEKMLVAGEKTVGQMSLSYGAFMTMGTIFRNMAAVDSEIGQAYSNELVQLHTAKLRQFQEDIERLIQPTLLYFDVEDLLYKLTSAEAPQLLMEQFGQRQQYILALAARSEADPGNAELDEAMDAAERDFQNDLHRLADMFDGWAQDTEAIIARIKDQLRRHRLPA